MPPAFVLSQNQTLMLTFDHRCPRGKTHGPPRPNSRSRSCTSHILWICNETYERLSFNRSSEALNSSVTGAAAHMSLHLNQQCQRADASPFPLSGATGLPIVKRRKREQANCRAPPVDGHIWRRLAAVNSLFSKLSEAGSGRRAEARAAPREAAGPAADAAWPSVFTPGRGFRKGSGPEGPFPIQRPR
jgi:hypothetical protein